MISYLNVRSLYAHQHDVERDNILMTSDVFSLGETWLHPGSKVHIDGYNSFHANSGHGKGVSTFIRNNLTSDPITYSSSSSELLSIAKIVQFGIDLIFVYVNKRCNKEMLLTKLHQMIDKSKPTVVLGDFNENFSETSTLTKALKSLDLHQIIQGSTHDKGNIIDHGFPKHNNDGVATVDLVLVVLVHLVLDLSIAGAHSLEH